MKAQEITDKYHITRRIKETKHLPCQAAIIIGRNFRKLDEAVKDIEEQRIAIIKRNAKKDDKGELIAKENGAVEYESAKAQAEAAREYDELMQTEIELELEHVPEDVIEKIDSDSRYDALTGNELEALIG